MQSRIQYFALNLFAFLAMLYVNYLSVSLPLNGNTPQILSDKYVNLFVPSGFTFSIWGIIYSFLIIFLIGQFWAALRGNNLFDKIGYFFVSTCILNATWLVTWHYEMIFVSVCIMLMLLATLIFYYLQNDFGSARYSPLQKLQLHAPFSLYLGWISVATIANITAFLVNMGWRGAPFGEVNTTVFMIIVAVILGVLMQFKRSDTLYGLVIIWALYGIYAKRIAVDALPQQLIIYALLGGIAAVAISIILNVIGKRKFLA